MSCSIEGCTRLAKARGYCTLHYQRLMRLGDANGSSKRDSEPVSFIKNVAAKRNEDKCLIWPYYRNSNSYGRVWHDGQLKVASRLVCELVNGPPDDPSLEARHTCNNGKDGCVSGNHLLWGTKRDNMDDYVAKTLDRRLALKSIAQERLKTDSRRTVAASINVSLTTLTRILRS